MTKEQDLLREKDAARPFLENSCYTRYEVGVHTVNHNSNRTSERKLFTFTITNVGLTECETELLERLIKSTVSAKTDKEFEYSGSSIIVKLTMLVFKQGCGCDPVDELLKSLGCKHILN